MGYFDEQLLLTSEPAKRLYETVRELPIIDYHCHLNEEEIEKDKVFSNIGELWLSGDHYKWRAMRLAGVEEYYITGEAPWEEKFLKFAEILPKMAGNPVYYWSQMELKALFHMTEPLTVENAKEIFEKSKAHPEEMTARYFLNRFNVEFVATTDDPLKPLDKHGTYGNTVVSPTFRADKVFQLDPEYMEMLSKVSGVEIKNVQTLEEALEERIQFFKEKGCRIADHGFDRIPDADVTKEEADEIFAHYENVTETERHRLFSYLMHRLARLYHKYHFILQLHFGTFRNINTKSYKSIGVDAGFDVFRGFVDTDALARFLDALSREDQLPKTILYSLNANATAALCTISGAFPGVTVGAAWWFNDTVEGIRNHLKTFSEYSVLGTNLGMLTDSRSFSGYVRFDFFRRILCSHVGTLVEKGEYDEKSAEQLVQDICYNNIKQLLQL